MILQQIKTPGLAHYAYIIAHQGIAAVIDPRRDVDIYIEATQQAGAEIRYILETHRHEDLVTGSLELSRRTGAQILHSPYEDFAYGYGDPIHHEEELSLGDLRLRAIHTPGHTLGHMSYLLLTPEKIPWALFSGDALMAGDVGRTDFYGPNRLEEMTNYLYDSIFQRILTLGDGVLLLPAHGAGSVCGSAIAERPWTTIGLERELNPLLRHPSRDTFLHQVARPHPYPPYFRLMEMWNRDGPPPLPPWSPPIPLSPTHFAQLADQAQILDIRDATAFAAAHIPGAISIWKGGLATFAGWFLDPQQPVLLVADHSEIISDTARTLLRIGFDHIAGTLAGGMQAWLEAGRPANRTPIITVQELCDHLDRHEDLIILDVRTPEETAAAHIPHSLHIPLTELPNRIDEIPTDLPIYTFCGSGLRSMIAASLIERAGRQPPTVVLGGLAGWNATSCPLELRPPNAPPF